MSLRAQRGNLVALQGEEISVKPAWRRMHSDEVASSFLLAMTNFIIF
jgi:hypothetical protein